MLILLVKAGVSRLLELLVHLVLSPFDGFLDRLSVILLSLSGRLTVVCNLSPPLKNMDSSGKAFFDSCTSVYSGASMEFYISSFLCRVMDSTEFSILSYKMVHISFLCFQRNV